jgi:hypothetical protein
MERNKAAVAAQGYRGGYRNAEGMRHLTAKVKAYRGVVIAE